MKSTNEKAITVAPTPKISIADVPVNIIKLDNEVKNPEYNPMQRKDTSSKAIKKLVMLVRSTYEYKKVFWFIKNALDVNRCAFYEGYSMENGFTIELHHAPLTLFDIVEAVAKKYVDIQGYYETFRVTKDVAMLHYKAQVGLIPLNPTAHDLVHEGHLPIHPDLIIGYWEEFLQDYSKYISEELKTKLVEFREFGIENKMENIPQIIKRSHVHLELEHAQLTKEVFHSFLDTKTRDMITGAR